VQGASGKKRVRAGGKFDKYRIDFAYTCRIGGWKDEAGVYA
jgi:hypothetical protein